MIGEVIGRLKIVSQHKIGKRGASWNCVCDCGKSIVLSTSQLIKGGYRSCGSHTRRSDKRLPVPSSLRKEFKSTVVTWEAMLSRCHYVKVKQKCYEGIEICDDWFSFELFLRDMGPRPSDDYSLDRIDPTLGYTKSNCRWILKSENSRNIRQNMSPERNAKVSAGVKLAHALGKILTPEVRAKIGAGGVKRRGRKLQSCSICGAKAYTSTCVKCR